MPTATDSSLLDTHRFDVEAYHRMGDMGLFEGQHVELLKGEIVDMSPINARHASMVRLLNELLSERLDAAYQLSVQNPIRLDSYTEPEPDLAVLHRRADYYAEAHPGPKDTLLLIEVADSSLERDEQVKLPLYAKAQIPEVWIVNLRDQQLVRYWGPSPDGYAHIHILKRGDTLPHELIGQLDLSRLFPKSV